MDTVTQEYDTKLFLNNVGYPSEFGQNDLVITLSCLEWVISRQAAIFTRSTFILWMVEENGLFMERTDQLL